MHTPSQHLLERRWLSQHRILRHDDVIKWKHFPRYWPFVRGIHRWPVNSPHKGQWRGGLIFSLIYAWINGWMGRLVIWDAIAPIITSLWWRKLFETQISRDIVHWKIQFHRFEILRKARQLYCCCLLCKILKLCDNWTMNSGLSEWARLGLSLPMLETVYSGFGGQYHTCWCRCS